MDPRERMQLSSSRCKQPGPTFEARFCKHVLTQHPTAFSKCNLLFKILPDLADLFEPKSSLRAPTSPEVTSPKGRERALGTSTDLFR